MGTAPLENYKMKVWLPCDPAILLLGVYTKEVKVGNQIDIYTSMFIAALFTIVQVETTQVSVSR